MSDTLRSGLIRLAYANPSLREELLPLIMREAAGKKQDKVRAVNQDGKTVWVNKDTLRKQPGKFKPYKYEEDKGKGGGAEKSEKPQSEKPKRSLSSVTKNESVRTLADKHHLEADEVAEVKEKAKSLADKSAKSKMSAAERKKKFMEMMDSTKYDSPEAFKKAKERIMKMSPGDFETMVFALADEEPGAEGGGKTASLRSGLIRLAYANPSLRPTLLPLIEKHAGEMDAELEEDADPTSHDQNLPEHYYFNKGAAKGESVEAILKQFASPKSKDQNKPESYYGLAPKGKQAAKEKNDYSPDTGETGKLRDDLVAALKKKGLEVEEGSSANTLYIDGEKVAIHGPHLEGEHVKEWVRKPSRKEWLAEAVKLLSK